MTQKGLFGINSINDLGKIIYDYQPKTILLISGRKSYSASGAAAIIDTLLHNYEVVRYNDIMENPKHEMIEEALSFLGKRKFDLVIAVGGGSVIDFAKLVNILFVQSGKAVDYVIGKKQIEQKGRPLVAVPTTAGSGSEATQFAVIYLNKIKYSLDHEYLLPDVAIVDPGLMMSMPKNVAASSGMDALSQAIESYWAVRSTDESKSYAKEAMGLIIDNIDRSVNVSDLSSRAAMAKGTNLAGKAINITRTTAAHAISYPITISYGISHGQAVGLTLPEIFEFNYQVNERDVSDPRGTAYVKNILKEIAKELGCRDVCSAAEKLRNIRKNIGLPASLSQVGIGKKEIPAILNAVDLGRLNNNPRIISSKALESILLKII